MTIKEVRKFGVLRKVFKGKGKIGLSDGNEYQSQFTLAQLSDAQLVFVVSVKKALWGVMAQMPQIVSLTGTLLDGMAVSAQGFVITKAQLLTTGKTQLAGYVGQWVIGELDFANKSLVSFELVNFRFYGTERELFITEDQQRSTLSLMTLTLGERDVRLRWVVDYDQVVASLQAQHGVQITCTLTTEIENPSEINTITSVIDTLCDVMSVARGTLVSWVSFDVAASENHLIYSTYRDSVTRRFSAVELIDHRDREHTKLFIERGFLRCQELERDFSIRGVARAFTETRDGPFINTRSLLMGVLVEHMASVRARVSNRLYFLDKESFDAQWNSFKTQVTADLTTTYPSIVKKHLPAMLGNIKGLNRRPFAWKVNDLAKWLDIKFEKSEVERFVQTRNLLAHESRFPEGGTPTQHYLRMQHFIDRIMLRLFDYHGPYYDIEHREMRQI